MWDTFFITSIERGVLIEDLVHYRIPFGLLGKILHPLIVKPKLENIFNVRTEKMHQLFGEYK